MLSIELINTEDGFAALEPIWDELVDYCEFPTPFQLHAWCMAWWRVFGENRKLIILLIKDNEYPVGIAPLMLTGSPGKGTLEFIGTGNADYTDFLIKPELKSESLRLILNYLNSNYNEWKIINLNQINIRSGTIDILNEVLKDFKYSYIVQEIESCHVYEYSDGESQREFFDSGMNRRQNIRNAVNFLKKRGGIEHESILSAERILHKLPDFFYLHYKRWSVTETPSKFLEENNRKFYYELTKNKSKKLNVRLDSLTTKGHVLAYAFSFEYKKDIYIYTPTYNLFYGKKSPGLLLYYYMTEYHIRQGAKNIDYMRGEEQYKNRLTNKSYNNNQIIIYKKKYQYNIKKLYIWLKKTAVAQKALNNKHLKPACKFLQGVILKKGLATTFKYGAKNFIRFFFEYKKTYLFEYSDLHGSKKSLERDFKLIEFDQNEIDVVASFYGYEMNSQQQKNIHKKFTNGERCFVLKDRDIYIAMCFVRCRPFHDMKNTSTRKCYKKHLELSDIDLIPEYDSEEIMMLLYHKINMILKKEGFSILFVTDDKRLSGYMQRYFNVLKTSHHLYLFHRRILTINNY
jgi:CelD/BcsL family acetyltransferase involved in cellulose biosynthesis